MNARESKWNKLLSNVMKDIAQFFGRGIFQAFAALGELLVDFDRCFLHHFVRFLRAANQQEVVAAREPLVAVFVVETNAQHAGFGFGLGGLLRGWQSFWRIQAIAGCHE
jgi:hypothetical protein